jgi:hypothetical protein
LKFLVFELCKPAYSQNVFGEGGQNKTIKTVLSSKVLTSCHGLRSMDSPALMENWASLVPNEKVVDRTQGTLCHKCLSDSKDRDENEKGRLELCGSQPTCEFLL